MCFKCRLNFNRTFLFFLEEHEKTNKSWNLNMSTQIPHILPCLKWRNGLNPADVFRSWRFLLLQHPLVLQAIRTIKPLFWQLERKPFRTTSFFNFRAMVHQRTCGWMRAPSKEFRRTQSRRRAAAGGCYWVPCRFTTWLDSSKAGVAEPCDTTFGVALGSLCFHHLSFVMHN